MMTGLFFGSFNPVHTGHLIIANYMAQYTEMDEVWLIVSPHNPLKKREMLAQMYDRLEMVKLAIEHSDLLKASDIEFRLPKPSYTIDTLTHLHEKYPERQFCLIMGADNLFSLPKWKNYEILLRDYKIYVYPRIGSDVNEWEQHPSVQLTSAPIVELSATFVRKAFAAHLDVRFFVPDAVIDFMEKKNMYR